MKFSTASNANFQAQYIDEQKVVNLNEYNLLSVLK